MYKHNKEAYQQLILNTAAVEKWEITIESDEDRKLQEILFGQPIKQKKMRNKKTLGSLIFIIYGKQALNSLLENGLI